MNIHTFGDKSNKTVVLIHGALCPWQMWDEAIEYFKNDYYVVVPELDGHTEDKTSRFTSVEEEAAEISRYLKENLDGKVYMLCGLSMGGRVAATVAKNKNLSIEKLVLDGAPLKKLPGILIGIMTKSYKTIIRKAKARDPKVLESFKKDFLPEKYLEEFLKIADNMEDASIDNMLESVFSEFEFIKYNSDMNILFMHGTKGNESVAAKGAVLMKKHNPQTEIRSFNGYAHAQLACFEQSKWIKEVLS